MKLFIKVLLLSILFFNMGVINAQVKKNSTRKTIVTKKAITKTPVKPQPIITSVPDVPKGVRIKIITSLGEMVVRLYDKTPKHRDNFIKLVKEHFYDSLLFHRVINTFMIQGGDPNSKYAQPGEMLGNGDVGYTIPAEFDSSLYHKRGALCAARTDNPEKASSGCQFYIVQGKPVSDGELDFIERKNGVTFSPAQRMTYKMNGGIPRLDMNYTVFGEVESGIEVVDKIALVQRDNNNRPVSDIRMRMELVTENEDTDKNQ